MKKIKYLLYFTLIWLFACGGGRKQIEEITKNKPKFKWSYSISNIPLDDAQPLIENGKAYVVADFSLSCVNLLDGKKIWTTSLGVQGYVSTMRVYHSGDTLYLSHAHWVRAFSKLSGNIWWEAPFDTYTHYPSEMAQDATHLYFGRRGEIVKINKQNGHKDLSIPLTMLVEEGQEQSATWLVLANDGKLYASTYCRHIQSQAGKENDGNMLCLDKSTGTLLWGYQIPHKLLNIGGIQMETGAHSEVCAVQDDKVVFLTGQEAFALNRHSGQLLWTVFFKEDGFTSSMTVADNKVLCGSVANPTIYALSLDNGSLLWKTPTNLVSIHNIFSVKDGKIYFCDGAKLYVMDIQSGRILWSTFPPEYAQDNDATFLSSLAIGEGYMVNVGSKYVYGYQL